MKTPSASTVAIKSLKTWATGREISRLGSVYVFGSSINADGRQFDRKTSDLDILLIRHSLGTDPLVRVEDSEMILSNTINLETKLMQALHRESANMSIVSMILASPEEIQLNIHKSTPDGFFARSNFLNVISGQKQPFRNFLSFDRERARGALACIAAAQKQRHWFLSVSANGTRLATEWDSDSEPLPKDLIRSAAQFRYCVEGLNDASEFDVNRGLDFCTGMVERIAKFDSRFTEIREWLSVRRGGKGSRTSLSPREHLLFYEILYQEAIVWLFEYIRGGSRKIQDVGTPKTVAVISTSDDLGRERIAIAEHLRRTPGIGDVREIRAEEGDGLNGIPDGALRVVLLGWRTGGTAVLRTALEVKDNVVVIASKAIEAEHVDIGELTEVLSLRKTYAVTQTFTSIEHAVAVAQDQVAEWLARQFANKPADRINLNSWETAYLRQRITTWEQGHHGPLQARRSKNQRLDRAQLYVSLCVDSDFCFEDNSGKLIVLPPNREEVRSPETHKNSHSRFSYDEHKRKATFLERAVSHPDLPHLVVEGEAGSGKTVLLQHISYTIGCYHLARSMPLNVLDIKSLAQGRPLVPVPIFLEARALSESLAELDGVAGLVQAIEREISKATGLDLPNGDVIGGLRAGRYILLIDSLDEVPSQEGRDAVARCLAGVSNQDWRSTVVLTTRPTAYTGSVTFGGRLRQIRIAHLNAAAVRMMVDRWSVFHNYGRDEQEALLAAVNEVAARHGGANMAENPLLLTVTMLVYDQQERLPDSTADLYKRIVEILCETRKSEITPATRRQLLELIFEGAQRAGGTSWVVEEAVDWLRRTRPDLFTSADVARSMLDRLGNETGLLLFESRSRSRADKNRGSNPNHGSNLNAARVVLRAWHRSFQEYLAACRLAAGVESVSKETDQLFEGRQGQPIIVENPTWEGVLRFLVGVYGDQGVDRARAYIERLYDHVAGARGASVTSRPGRVLGLVASGLTEYSEYFRSHPLLDTVKSELLQEFEKTGTTWPLVDRLLALEALGRLGDPRLMTQQWIEVPGGRVMYETSDSDSPRVARQHRSATVDKFYIMWSPVTVHDYRPFVEQGYADKKWWDPEALDAFGAAVADVTLSAEIPGSATTDAHTLPGGQLPLAPEDWARQIHHPNHPVVGISWYEARAFCRWATDNWCTLPSSHIVDLPSEDEWHYAAFGTMDRTYPWGTDALGTGDEARASYRAGGAPDVATPVGAFPLGNRTGIVDLVGNVWEWCCDTQAMSDSDHRTPRHGLGNLAVAKVGVLKGSCGHGPPTSLGRSRRQDIPLNARLPCHGFRVICRPKPSLPNEPTPSKGV